MSVAENLHPTEMKLIETIIIIIYELLIYVDQYNITFQHL